MSKMTTIEVNGKSYNMGQASAVDQQKLVHHVMPMTIMYMKQGGINEIDVNLVKSALMLSKFETVREIAEIVLSKCALSGDTVPVSVEHFQGEMHAFYELVSKGVKYNLQDFFTALENEHKAEIAEQERRMKERSEKA